MRKINYVSEINESVLELEQLLKEQTSSKLKERCEILIWLKSGQVLTMKAAVRLKNRTAVHGMSLWKKYKKGGITEYISLNYHSKQSQLTGKKELEEHLEKEGFRTINEARIWILKTYNINYTENGLGNYFRNKKIKLKTGRPHHPKKDEEKREAYKKNMP